MESPRRVTMASTGSAVRPEDVHEWGQQLAEVARRIGARFPRSETRDRVRAYLIGLLGPVQRKNAWQVAEQIGDADPLYVSYAGGHGVAGRPALGPGGRSVASTATSPLGSSPNSRQ